MRTQDIQPAKRPVKAGLAALENNVAAAMAMADVVRTTLGPGGLDKLLVDQIGNRVITNDGYTVLVSLRTTHPISRLLVEIAERQEVTVGDGTTSAIIMAAEMLREGYRIASEDGIHPSRILPGLDEGMALLTDYLQKVSVPIMSINDPRLQNVLKTATASKLDGDQLSALIMRSIVHLGEKNQTDLRHGLVLVRRLGDDEFLDGIAIGHLPVEMISAEEIGTPRACLIRDSLKFPLPGSPSSENEGREDRERMVILAKLASEHVNIIITNAPEIDTGLKMTFVSRKILLIRVTTEELGLLSLSLSIPMVYAVQLLGKTALPSFSSRELSYDEEKGLTILKGPDSGAVATLIIGGATAETSKERTRTCVDGISAVHFAMKGGVVAGGGIAELNAARYLQKKMQDESKDYAGLSILIRGLEIVSRQILENAGYDGSEMLTKLRERADGEGINVMNGEYIPMIGHGIVDPCLTKLHAIQVATHITKTILKIDRNLVKDDGTASANTS
jgi:chaperonin GroEL (HSP60 family)